MGTGNTGVTATGGIPSGENVSRTNTQLSEIDPRTAKQYLDEFETKYQSDRPDITVADTEGNRKKLEDAGLDPDRIIGRPLTGRQYLEIPVQNGPPRLEFLEDAGSRRPPVIVRDKMGTEWSVEDGSIFELRADGTEILHMPGDRS